MYIIGFGGSYQTLPNVGQTMSQLQKWMNYTLLKPCSLKKQKQKSSKKLKNNNNNSSNYNNNNKIRRIFPIDFKYKFVKSNSIMKNNKARTMGHYGMV